MALADRYYMRDGPRQFPLSATTILMIVLVAVFALQCVNDVYLHSRAEGWLALTTDGLRHGWVWQLLTFQFLHNGLLHVVFNLIVLWWTGTFAEGVLGKRRFLTAYFIFGAAGGMFQGALMLLFPAHFGESVVGASAGVSGLLALFALLERNSTVRLNFILPIPAIVLLWITAGISLFFTLVPTPREMGVAHAAHLGGILAGVAWVKLGWHRDYIQLPWVGWIGRCRRWTPLQSRQRKRELVRAASVRGQPWRQPPADPELNLPAEEFISREVDPILDKISAHGIQSLTERERKILEAARKKMAKR